MHSFNSVKISPFTGEKTDEELLKLSNFLVTLRDYDDVRPIAKRWERYILGKSLWPDAAIDCRKKHKSKTEVRRREGKRFGTEIIILDQSYQPTGENSFASARPVLERVKTDDTVGY